MKEDKQATLEIGGARCARGPQEGYWRRYMQCLMLVILATTRRSRSYSRTSTGQTTRWMSETTCWDVRSAKSEKSVHKLPAGLLQPLQLPEEKWRDVSLDFIMGLPTSERGNDGILTVVDRATKMVHLVPVQQTITAAETARVYWDNIGRLTRDSHARWSVIATRDLCPSSGRSFGRSSVRSCRCPVLTTPRQMDKRRQPTGWWSKSFDAPFTRVRKSTTGKEYLSMVEFVINSSCIASHGVHTVLLELWL